VCYAYSKVKPKLLDENCLYFVGLRESWANTSEDNMNENHKHNCKQHTIGRLKSRYGIHIDDDEYQKLCRRIEGGDALKIKEQVDNKTEYVIALNDTLIPVIFDVLDKVLPTTRITEISGEILLARAIRKRNNELAKVGTRRRNSSAKFFLSQNH